MPDYSWMTKFCNPQMRSPVVQTPHMVDAEGKTWSVTTDGRILVAIPGPLLIGFVPNCEESVARQITPFLAPYPTVATLDYAELKVWCGKSAWPKPCDVCNGAKAPKCSECDGKGYKWIRQGDYTYNCGECGGEGYRICRYCDSNDGMFYPDDRHGRLLDASVVNRVLLANAFEHLEASTVAVARKEFARTSIAEWPVLLTADTGWRVVIQPMLLSEPMLMDCFPPARIAA